MARYCPKCGSALSEKAAFCKACGAPVKRRQASAPTATAGTAGGAAAPMANRQAAGSATPGQQPAKPTQQPATPGQQPATPTQQPATPNQQPATPGQQTATPPTAHAAASAAPYSRNAPAAHVRSRARASAALAGAGSAAAAPPRARGKVNVPALALAGTACLLALCVAVVWVVGSISSHEQVVRSLSGLSDEGAWFGGLAYVCMAGVPALVALFAALSLASGAASVAQRGSVSARSIVGAAFALALCVVALVCVLEGPRIPAFADGASATIVTAISDVYPTVAAVAAALALAAVVATVFARRLSRARSV